MPVVVPMRPRTEAQYAMDELCAILEEARRSLEPREFTALLAEVRWLAAGAEPAETPPSPPPAAIAYLRWIERRAPVPRASLGTPAGRAAHARFDAFLLWLRLGAGPAASAARPGRCDTTEGGCT